MEYRARHPMAQYIFTFEDGGWNSVYAQSKAEAIQTAQEKYKDSSMLEPDPKSFFLKKDDEEAYDMLLSLFH